MHTVLEKTCQIGVFDVTPKQLAAMPKLYYNGDVVPKVGDYIVVYTNVMFGYWFDNIAVCSKTYETLQDATKYVTWASRKSMHYCIHKQCGVACEREVWHVVSNDDDLPMQYLQDCSRPDEDCTKCPAYMIYHCGNEDYVRAIFKRRIRSAQLESLRQLREAGRIAQSVEGEVCDECIPF